MRQVLASSGNVQKVLALLEASADVNAWNADRETPWDLTQGRELLEGTGVRRGLTVRAVRGMDHRRG